MLNTHNRRERLKAILIAAVVLAVVFAAVTLPIYKRNIERGENVERTFRTVVVEYNNFIRISNNMQLFCIVFLLLATRLPLSFSPVFLLRRRSRLSAINADVWSLLLFAAEFAAVLEGIHLVGTTLLFGTALPSQYGFYLFSAADFFADWLFFFRLGLLLLLANVFMKKTFAPFAALAVCLLLYYAADRVSVLYFPFYDAVVLPYLIAGVTKVSELPFAYLRSLVADGVLAAVVVWLFRRKDVMTV